MNIKSAVDGYIDFRKSLGERGTTNAYVLRSFCRAVGQDASMEDISPDAVRDFLAGAGPLTASWHVKHNALLGFYRYAQSRGLAASSPLPLIVPQRPPAYQPYIYTHEELKRLIEGAASYQRNKGHIDHRTVRTILLLLYGGALRVSEALSLTCADVDLDSAVLTIRNTKFYKSRLVPMGPDLTREMRAYAGGDFKSNTSMFFKDRHGQRINQNTLQYNFERLRAHTGLRRDGGSRCQPRMHDLRHTSAVHRLTWCYRQGGDVQKFLPQLSVYMGHAQLAGTQVYLSMTPQLLQEASLRFERYCKTGERS